MNTKYIRVIVALLLVAVMVTALTACGKGAEPEKNSLSKEMKAEISDAVKQKTGYPVDWLRARYYGTYDGYIVILEPTDLQAYTTKEVAGYSFTVNTSFWIFAYKDGVVYSLQEAYENGLLTEDQIGQIWERHMEYES